MGPEELVKAGQVDEALKALTAVVRKNPSDAKSRVFLFQLLCIVGDWDRALTQLNVAAELDASNLLMAQVCRPALQCEALRAEIFAGRRSPMVLGEPEPWFGWLIQAAAMTGSGDVARGADLRAKAFEAAPETPGVCNGQAFDWIMDADSRIGPAVEAIIEGRYYWIPFSHIASFTSEGPTDLRDFVWLPGTFQWTNGGESVALIPTRYPGSDKATDERIRLARMTTWQDLGHDTFVGLGQRMLALGETDMPLLEVRSLVLGSASTADAGGGG